MKKQFALAYLINFVIVLGMGFVTSLLSVYLASQNISLTNIGFIFAFGAIAAGFLRIPIGACVDYFGRRKFIIAGSIGFVVYGVGIAFATTVPDFIALNLLFEIVAAVFWTAFTAFYMDILEKGLEGKQLAIRNTFGYVATAASPVIAGLIASAVGFKSLFLAGAAVAAVAIPAALAISMKTNSKNICFDIKQEYSDVTNVRGFNIVLITLIAHTLVWTFWSIYMPIYLKENGVSLASIGLILTSIWGIGAVLQIPLGKLIDKYPARWILVPGFFLVWVGGLLFFQFQNFLNYLVSRVIMGLGFDLAYWPAIGVFARHTPKKINGAGWAALMAGVNIVYGLAALAGGFLTDNFGIDLVLYASSFLAIIIGILLIPNKTFSESGLAHSRHKPHQHIHHHTPHNRRI
ncbi:MAG: MFS transporter [DPANN group archaeon]|nr:MFS transporter [DPANN group archaeon]